MNRQILEEASAWFIEFRAGSMSAATHAQFVHWLTLSPEHIRAYLEISGTYTQLPKPGAMSDDIVADLLQRARRRIVDSVTPLPEGASARVSASWGPEPLDAAKPPRASHWRTWALAATILLTMGTAASLFDWQRGLYTTDTAEERTVTLEDGSRIELNARSGVRVSYSKSARNVELLDGQALFEVAKDATRPFLVHSAAATVRAVGTQFDVYRQNEETTVTVVEGRVAVYAPEVQKHQGDTNPAQHGHSSSSAALPRVPHSGSGSSVSPNSLSGDTSGATVSVQSSVPSDSVLDPSGAAAIFLSAGEQVTVTPNAVASPRRANVTSIIAWTRGQLEFEETPLPEVAEEFNRYSLRRLVLESPSLKSFKISGVYSAADPESLILFLRGQPDLIVDETGSEIRIRSK